MSLKNYKGEQVTAIRSKDQPWYANKSTKDTAAGYKLLRDYSKIQDAEIDAHVRRCRDIAWETFPFPCVGRFGFLECGITLHPHYGRLLDLARQPQAATDFRLLDLGTCFGQDLRMLMNDGVPKESLYGSDLFPGFEKAGHELFLDSDTFKGHFLEGDILDEDSGLPLAKTYGTWDVINIQSFLHQFDLPQQTLAARQILRLLKPRKGSLVLGNQVGSLKSGEEIMPPPLGKDGARTFMHDKATMITMWDEAAESVGGEWKAWADYADEDYVQGDEKTAFFSLEGRKVRVDFVMERVS